MLRSMPRCRVAVLSRASRIDRMARDGRGVVILETLQMVDTESNRIRIYSMMQAIKIPRTEKRVNHQKQPTVISVINVAHQKTTLLTSHHSCHLESAGNVLKSTTSHSLRALSTDLRSYKQPLSATT